MISRETLFQSLVGDLEYHPQRGIAYLAVGSVALTCAALMWAYEAGQILDVTRFVLGAGGAVLILKAIFFFRKSSDGLGGGEGRLDLSGAEAARLARAPTVKRIPAIPALAAQVVQDFGAGAILLGTVLRFSDRVSESRNLTDVYILFVGVAIFFAGLLLRYCVAAASFGK